MVTWLRNASYLNGYIDHTLFLLTEKILQTLIYRHSKDKAVEIEQVQIMCQSQEKLVMAGEQGELFRTVFLLKTFPSLDSTLRMCVFRKGYAKKPTRSPISTLIIRDFFYFFSNILFI